MDIECLTLLSSLRTKHGLHLTPDGDSMIINYAPTYRFKNDKTGVRPSAIKLRRYASLISERNEGERNRILEGKLCPVRAVEIYLKSTKESNNHFLFVNPNDFNKQLSSRQAAGLVQGLVKSADQHSVFTIRETRSFASSNA